MNQHRSRNQLFGTLILALFLTLFAGLLSNSAVAVTPPVQEVDSTLVKSSAAYDLAPVEQVVVELETGIGGESRHDFSRRFAGSAWAASSPSAVSENCTQLLGNSELTVSGESFSPWTILDPEVYYTYATFASAPNSVSMKSQDEGFASDKDAFGQVVEIPAGNLTKVTVEYATSSVNSSGSDQQGGAIWTIDAAGNSDTYVTEWAINDSDGQWERRLFVIADNGRLNKMEGKEIVLIFFFDTDNKGKAETVFFDDITLTACTEDLDIPAAPSDLTAQAVSDMQVALGWTDNSDNEDGFKIEHSLTGSDGWTEIATTAATEYTALGLACDTSHSFRVRAYNAWGDSAYSNTAGDTTFACELPAKYAYFPVTASNYWSGYFDDFSDPNSGWFSGEYPSVKYGYIDGEYQILLKSASWGAAVTPDWVLPADYRIEVEARQAAANTSSYGLIFGALAGTDGSEQYQFVLFPMEQKYMLQKKAMDGTWTCFISATYSSAIHQGTAANHLRVERIGSRIELYINGTHVADYDDDSFSSPGRDAGLRAYSYDNAPVDVRFDNFSATPP